MQVSGLHYEVPTRMHMATNVLPCTTAAKAL
jgi:hypothetical protein